MALGANGVFAERSQGTLGDLSPYLGSVPIFGQPCDHFFADPKLAKHGFQDLNERRETHRRFRLTVHWLPSQDAEIMIPSAR